MQSFETWECVVVGGGAAGLSAALVLGRARRRTLVVDAGAQSNLPAHGIGGLLGHDGTPPAQLYAAGRGELSQYPSVAVRDGEVVAARPDDDGDGFVVTLAPDEEVRTRRLLLATGMAYVPPDLPGVAERWGRDVFHCPFCHGWEVRDGALAVLAAVPGSTLQALLLRGWSDDVVLLAGPGSGAELEPDDRERLADAGVRVDEREVARLRIEDDRLAAVVFADGSELARDAVLVYAPLHPRSDLPAQLGLALTDSGAVAVDGRAATSRPGVFAAGDGAGTMPQVAQAVGAGALAGAMVAHEILTGGHAPARAAPAGAAA